MIEQTTSISRPDTRDVVAPQVSRWRTHRSADARANALTIVVLSIGTLIILFPFAWMLSTAVKEQADLYLYPPEWIPNPIRYQNFGDTLSLLPFWTFAKNSAIIVGGVIF